MSSPRSDLIELVEKLNDRWKNRYDSPHIARAMLADVQQRAEDADMACKEYVSMSHPRGFYGID